MFKNYGGEKMDRERSWREFKIRKYGLLSYGLRNGLIRSYTQEEIDKFRDIYYDGVPASIILLTMRLTNGLRYDGSALLSRAFLDSDDRVRLICLNIDSLRLNPNNDGSLVEHCVVERVTSTGEILIYDASQGLVFSKIWYWQIEKPEITSILEKSDIIDYFSEENLDNQFDRESSKLIIPWIEELYGSSGEIYFKGDNSPLRQEISRLKKKIDSEKGKTL